MDAKRDLDSTPCATESSIAQKDSIAGNKKKKRLYSPPQILSSEPLELAAVGCDGTAGFGKPSIFSCNPGTPGS